MQSLAQYNQSIVALTLARDIKLGGIKTIRQLMYRAGKTNINYNQFNKLKLMLGK